MKIPVDELTGLLLDKAAAKLQRIRVEEFRGRCYIRKAFDPEGPAHYFDPQHRFMLRLYEPSRDWAIAGPIIEVNKIALDFSSNVLEAAMRDYVRLAAGADFDFDRPLTKAHAIVKVVTMKDDAVDETAMTVLARTEQEAVDIAYATHAAIPPKFDYVDATFQGWGQI